MIVDCLMQAMHACIRPCPWLLERAQYIACFMSITRLGMTIGEEFYCKGFTEEGAAEVRKKKHCSGCPWLVIGFETCHHRHIDHLNALLAAVCHADKLHSAKFLPSRSRFLSDSAYPKGRRWRQSADQGASRYAFKHQLSIWSWRG